MTREIIRIYRGANGTFNQVINTRTPSNSYNNPLIVATTQINCPTGILSTSCNPNYTITYGVVFNNLSMTVLSGNQGSNYKLYTAIGPTSTFIPTDWYGSSVYSIKNNETYGYYHISNGTTNLPGTYSIAIFPYNVWGTGSGITAGQGRIQFNYSIKVRYDITLNNPQQGDLASTWNYSDWGKLVNWNVSPSGIITHGTIGGVTYTQNNTIVISDLGSFYNRVRAEASIPFYNTYTYSTVMKF